MTNNEATALRGAARGAALLMGARVALNGAGLTLRSLRKLPSMRVKRSEAEGVASARRARVPMAPMAQLAHLLLGNGALRWALFGALLKLALRRDERSGALRAALGGVLAGVAFRAMPRSYRRGCAIFATTRALEVGTTMGIARGFLPGWFGYGDVVIMVVSSIIVCNGLGFYPAAVEPTYLRFLRIQMGVDTRVYDAFVAMAQEKEIDLDAINDYRGSTGLELLTTARGHLVDDWADAQAFFNRVLYNDKCSTVRDQIGWFSTFYRDAMLRAMPIYAPILAIQLVRLNAKRAAEYALVLSQRVRRGRAGGGSAAARAPRLQLKPLSPLIFRLVKSFLRSSVFLSSYCCWGVLSIGIYNAARGRFSRTTPLVAGGVCGLALLLEHKARRMDLALFVGSKALDIALRLAERSTTLQRRERDFAGWRFVRALADPSLIAIPSMALLAYALAYERSALRRGIFRSAFEFFVDA